MNSEQKKKFRAYPESSGWFLGIVGVLTASIAVISLIVASMLFSANNRDGLLLLALIWSVLPPLWFWIEYYFVYRKFGNADAFDAFKHGQDLSKALWLGLAAGMYAAIALVG